LCGSRISATAAVGTPVRCEPLVTLHVISLFDESTVFPPP
jgi:hypothetical protein